MLFNGQAKDQILRQQYHRRGTAAPDDGPIPVSHQHPLCSAQSCPYSLLHSACCWIPLIFEDQIFTELSEFSLTLTFSHCHWKDFQSPAVECELIIEFGQWLPRLSLGFRRRRQSELGTSFVVWVGVTLLRPSCCHDALTE